MRLFVFAGLALAEEKVYFPTDGFYIAKGTGEYIARENCDCKGVGLGPGGKIDNVETFEDCLQHCNDTAECRVVVYSKKKKRCIVKKNCKKSKIQDGEPVDYAARLSDENRDFRLTTVAKCNNDEGVVQINAQLVNPIGGVPTEFTQSFVGSHGATATFSVGDTGVETSFEGTDLVLSTTVGSTSCERVSIDGVSVCVDTGESFTFKCRYPLTDQTVTDQFDVSGQDTESSAANTGTLGYTLTTDQTNEIGDEVNFTITPKNPDLVFATVKSCDVSRAGQSITIIGHNQEKCLNPLIGASAKSNKTFSSKQSIHGSWTAFKWATSRGLADQEAQNLSCTIGLSKTKDTSRAENCATGN